MHSAYDGLLGARRRGSLRYSQGLLRTLLFSTEQRGQMVESMHVRLKRNETVQNFSIWIYGDDNPSCGSGIFVGEDGVATNHHFLTPKESGLMVFLKAAIRWSYLPNLFMQKAMSCCGVTHSKSLIDMLPNWKDPQQEYSSIGVQTLNGIYPMLRMGLKVWPIRS